MTYIFQNATAFDPYTGRGVPNASGQVFAMSDTAFATPLTVILLSSGLQTTELVSDQYSQLPGFDAGDNVQVRFRSGEFVKVLNTSTPLLGPQGDTGKSAFEVAVEGGYTGTEAEYNATLTDAPNLVARAETAEAAAVDAANLVGAPADTAIATAINGPGTLTGSALSAAIGYIGGLADDGVTSNSAKIQAALNLGGRWMLPPTAGSYAVGSTLNINVPGTQLYAVSAPIKSTHTMPVFQVNAADVVLDIPDVTGAVGAPNFTGMTGSFEGSSRDSAWCVVNAAPAAHRLSIPRMFGRGFSAVVRMGGWDYDTGTYSTVATEDPHLGTIGCDYVEFGVALRGTRRLKIDTISGRYGNTVGGARPPHLVYLANGGALHKQWNIGTATATGGLGGQAFQFKDCIGGASGPLLAEGCYGVLNIMDSHDNTFGPISSRGDTYAASAGSFTMDAILSATGNRFESIDVEMISENQSVVVYNGADNEFGPIRVRTKHTTTGGSTMGDVEVRGQRNKFAHVSVDNTGGTNSWAGFVIFSGEDHHLGGFEGKNVRVGVNGRDKKSTLNVDRSKITLHPTDGLYTLSAASSLGITSPRFFDPASVYLTGNPRMVAADDFTIAQGSFSGLGGSLSGHIWRASAGATWKADGNGRAYESTGVQDKMAWLETGSPNIEMECNITWQSGEGLVIRYVDATNHLQVIIAGTTTILRKVESGATTTLTTTTRTHVAGRGYHLRVKAQGDSIRVWEDGDPILSHTLSAPEQALFGASGNHGLRSSSSTARFDTALMLRT